MGRVCVRTPSYLRMAVAGLASSLQAGVLDEFREFGPARGTAVCLNIRPPRDSIAECSTSSWDGERRSHPIGVCLPPTGRTLNIGDQERHHPRRGSARHGIASAHFMCPLEAQRSGHGAVAIQRTSGMWPRRRLRPKQYTCKS